MLRSPAAGTIVRIQIEHEGASAAAYRAVISTPEGREVWARSGQTPIRPGAPTVVVEVPASTLLPGDYVLTLSAGSTGGRLADVGAYSFRVAPR